MKIATTLVALTALAGCAAPPYLGVRSAAPPLPAIDPSMTFREELFTGAGGLPMYGRSYRPASGEPRGVLVIQHGLKDHGEHYVKVAEELVKRGYAVYALDMRGHGRSAGERVKVDRFDDYIDDLEIFVTRVREREPNRPIFVFGHSLGGAIVTLYGIDRHPQIAGIILSGPALALVDPAVAIAVVRLADGINPNAPLLAPKHPDFSRDPAIVADMDRDPLIFQEGGPVHTAGETLSASHRIWNHPESLTVPLLALHGTADKLTAPSGSRDLVVRAGGTDKTLRLYEGFYHDLVHEPGRERVVADILGWLDAHTGGPPESAPKSDAPKDASAETLPLPGDAVSQSTSVQIDGRFEHAFAGPGASFAGTGGLRLRQAFGRIGWLGGLDLRAGSEAGFRWEADLHALGLGVRLGHGQLGLTGGIGLHGLDGTTFVRVPSELSLELPVGPLRLLSRGGLGWRLNQGGPGTSVLKVADEATAFVGLRFGRDLRYWADTNAGQGPFLGATYARHDGVDLWGVALGLDLWGAK